MKPKRIKIILPLEELCSCGAYIAWEKGELFSEYEKRYLLYKKHNHGKEQ